MTAPGIDACSSVPLYVEAFFGDQVLGGATAFLWLGQDHRLTLVTNWHVVSGRNHETGEATHRQGGIPDQLRVHVPLNERKAPPRIVIVPLVDAEGGPLWVEHPKFGHEVDIAALSVDLPPPSGADLIPLNLLKTVALKQRVGMSVFILGYPFGRMGAGFPVWKHATFASEPFLSPVHDHRFLIVDTASRPGMSGSPVIQRAHGQIELEGRAGRLVDGGDGALSFIGIYSGRFHTTDAMDAQLGRVWPAALVKEVVRAAESLRQPGS